MYLACLQALGAIVVPSRFMIFSLFFSFLLVAHVLMRLVDFECKAMIFNIKTSFLYPVSCTLTGSGLFVVFVHSNVFYQKKLKISGLNFNGLCFFPLKK